MSVVLLIVLAAAVIVMYNRPTSATARRAVGWSRC